MDQLYRDAMRDAARYFDHMGAQQWLVVAIVAVVVGVICLRGFGSRSGY